MLTSFKRWMKQLGITWDAKLIKFVDNAPECSGFALGIFAARDVAEGDELALIPKSACLNIRTTEIADILETEELGGGLGLVIAVAYEMTNPKSKWSGYFAACPSREYLPMFWTDDEVELLKGTELEGVRETDQAEIKDDYKTNVMPLFKKYPKRLSKSKLTLKAFQAAASLVASRAFGVDEYHGDSMVPLADVFNHKVSVVELAPEYAIHGAQSSSDEEESDSEEDEEESDSEEEVDNTPATKKKRKAKTISAKKTTKKVKNEQATDVNNKTEEEPPVSFFSGQASNSHVPAVIADEQNPVVNGLASANGLHLRLEIGIIDRDDHLSIVAASDIAKGCEIHNTYGELGNHELVKKYGFCLRQNPLSAVTVHKWDLYMYILDTLMDEFDSGIQKIVQKESGLLDDDSEPFEVLPNGCVGPTLHAFIRCMRFDRFIVDDDDVSHIKTLSDLLRMTERDEKSGEDFDGDSLQIFPVRNPTSWEHLDEYDAEDVLISEGKDLDYHDVLTGFTALEGLYHATKDRLGRYMIDNDTLSYYKDIERLDDIRSKAGTAVVNEHTAAELSATLLRITEQEILWDMLRAVKFNTERIKEDMNDVSLETLYDSLLDRTLSLFVKKKAPKAAKKKKQTKKKKAVQSKAASSKSKKNK